MKWVGEEGMRAMGLMPFEAEGAQTEGEREVVREGNEVLGFEGTEGVGEVVKEGVAAAGAA
jgi:hypothetical protein